MAGRGGYQKPTNPAPVSGPGALSQRTDGGPADPDAMRLSGGGKYGETKDLEEIQGGASMRPQMPAVTPLDAPSSMPGEPITAGADAGAGPGMEALGIPNPDLGDVQALVAYLPALEFMASRPNAAPSTRAFVRRIKSLL